MVKFGPKHDALHYGRGRLLFGEFGVSLKTFVIWAHIDCFLKHRLSEGYLARNFDSTVILYSS